MPFTTQTEQNTDTAEKHVPADYMAVRQLEEKRKDEMEKGMTKTKCETKVIIVDDVEHVNMFAQALGIQLDKPTFPPCHNLHFLSLPPATFPLLQTCSWPFSTRH